MSINSNVTLPCATKYATCGGILTCSHPQELADIEKGWAIQPCEPSQRHKTHDATASRSRPTWPTMSNWRAAPATSRPRFPTGARKARTARELETPHQSTGRVCGGRAHACSPSRRAHADCRCIRSSGMDRGLGGDARTASRADSRRQMEMNDDQDGGEVGIKSATSPSWICDTSDAGGERLIGGRRISRFDGARGALRLRWCSFVEIDDTIDGWIVTTAHRAPSVARAAYTNTTHSVRA